MLQIFKAMILVVVCQWGYAEEVNFNTADNATIYANFQGTGEHAVLLAHGAVFNKASWGKFEQTLLNKGYTVLAIDFRGYNKSTQGDKVQALHEDILAGVRFLKLQQNIKQVTVLGASMGAIAAAKASVFAEPNEIDQLILLSPSRVYKPESLKGQLLFIASEQEPLTKVLKSSFIKAPEPKSLKLIEGKAHAQHIFKTAQASVLTEAIINFLEN